MIHERQVDIFKCEHPFAPLVLLNTYGNEGSAVFDKCSELGAPEFHMAAVSNLNWDDDMTPWAIEPIMWGNNSYAGKADKYLEILTDEIIPFAKKEIGADPTYIAIAGYSLGGLFAVYSLYKSKVFSAAMSASGSFWYPDFLDYVKKKGMPEKADCVYFSLGDREKYTSNEYLKTVQDKTMAIHRYYKENGIITTFELNKGNHFQQGTLRTAKGIKWMLENKAIKSMVTAQISQ